jgi:hypothetical protein
MVRDFERKDEGMSVKTNDGDEVGTIETVEGSTARVKPESNLDDSIRQRLGWDSDNQSMYELDHSKVEAFDGDEVRLKD